MHTNKVHTAKRCVEKSGDFGIYSNLKSVDAEKITKRSKDINIGLNKSFSELLARNKVKVIEGAAKFKDRNTLSVKNGSESIEIKSKNSIIHSLLKRIRARKKRIIYEAGIANTIPDLKTNLKT